VAYRRAFLSVGGGRGAGGLNTSDMTQLEELHL